MKKEQRPLAPRPNERPNPDMYLNHGVESLVAIDNPDDSQLGAERKQTKNEEQTP